MQQSDDLSLLMRDLSLPHDGCGLRSEFNCEESPNLLVAWWWPTRNVGVVRRRFIGNGCQSVRVDPNLGDLSRGKVASPYDLARALSNCPNVTVFPNPILAEPFGSTHRDCLLVRWWLERAEMNTLRVHIFSGEHESRESFSGHNGNRATFCCWRRCRVDFTRVDSRRGTR